MATQNQPIQRTFVKWKPRQGHAPTPNTSWATNPQNLRRPNAPAPRPSPATQTEPRWDLVLPGEPLACDIEFQDYHIAGDVHGSWHKKAGNKRWQNRLGWICIVNTRGEIILDTFVSYPSEANVEATMPRAPGKTFGVTWKRVDPRNGAVDGRIVEEWCEKLFANRTVVLHGGSNDRRAWYYQDPFARATVRDTQWLYRYSVEGENKPCPGLALLAENLLNRIIQVGNDHAAEEDALATMDIYLLRNPYDRVAEATRWQAVYRG